MLASCVRAELVKLRRSPIWLVFVALPGISALIGCANYQGNLGVITPGWSNLWTQQTLFVGFALLPALLVAGCVALGVPGEFPAACIAEYVTLGVLGSLVVVAIQLDISMVVRNFAAPVGIALAGGVSGVIATVAGLGNVWPYSLLQTGMNSNELVDLSATGVIQVVVFSVVYASLAIAWACRRLSRRDVVATM